MLLRAATITDLADIEAIYQYYVETSIATFEESSERSTDFTMLFNKGMPFIVAVDKSRIVGYAYVRPYHVRAAYRHTVENSIYVHHLHSGQGLGKRLLKALVDALQDTPIKQVVAAMSIMPDHDEEDVATCRLHRSFGFTPAGRLRAVGFKFDKWIDVVYYQLSLTTSHDEK